MISAWLPNVKRTSVLCNGGTYQAGARLNGLLHTIESNTWDSAMSVFRSSYSAPHLMYDPRNRRLEQFLPFNVSACALKNLPGGVETNRQGAIQVELVGYAGETHTWPDNWLRNIALDVVGPISNLADIKLKTIKQYGADAGFILASPYARQRLTHQEWLACDYWVSHQNAPENDHWDCGALDIQKIIDFISPVSSVTKLPQGDTEMILIVERTNKKEIGRCALHSHTDKGPLMETVSNPKPWRSGRKGLLQATVSIGEFNRRRKAAMEGAGFFDGQGHKVGGQ